MSTDDCSIIGRSPCPCGKGEVLVEYCIPDYPWARDSQGRHGGIINCEECPAQYAFFQREPNDRPRLILREQAERIRDATQNWHNTLREIEASSNFKRLSAKLDQTLDEQRSAAAAHRLLVAAKLTHDSIGQYRRNGYKLSPLHAVDALKLFGERDLDLEELIAREERYDELRREIPPAIKTGNAGLVF